MREIRNAKVESTHLGFEGHGILTAVLRLTVGGWGQGFGCRCYGGHEGHTDKQARAFRTFVVGVLKLFEVEKWEDLRGKFCRVDADGGHVYRVGRLLEDVWFDPDAGED